ncbi:hypothetical protein Y032_0014g2307 [Ancylostoma ceylanicum]|uniref:Uncharacterized protein n=1 Tax=Ancylostoma ceylanicum TaxID=53326 RepID=A0A016V9J4_9BILA|nr:hypothetical protein Y032_0014g2307 [Ancylostoma ceylanicum]
MQSTGCSSSDIPTTASFRQMDQAAQISLPCQTSDPAPPFHQSASALLANPGVTSLIVVTHSNPAFNSFCPQLHQPASSSLAQLTPASQSPSNAPLYTFSYTMPQLMPAPLYLSTQSHPHAAFSAAPQPTPSAHSVDVEVDTAPTSQKHSNSTAARSNATLSFASRDLRLLLSTLESVASDASCSQPNAQLKSPHCQRHLLGAEDSDLLNIAPRLGYRAMTPFEACYLYAQGKFQFLDVPVEERHSHAIPAHARAALRLAQTLTVASNFDYTFSLAHLSARDLMMSDAFLRDDIYTHLRDSVIGEANTAPANHVYPCIRDFPLSNTIRSLKGLHAATKQLTTLRMELFTETDQWESADRVIDNLEILALLIRDLGQNRAALDMHITPLITNTSVEDIQNIVDMLDYHKASPLTIQLAYNAATAELAHAYTLHQALTNRLRRLCCPEFQSSEPDVPNIPLTQSPSSNTWTTLTTAQSHSNSSFANSSSTVDTVTQVEHPSPSPQPASNRPLTYAAATASNISTVPAASTSSSASVSAPQRDKAPKVRPAKRPHSPSLYLRFATHRDEASTSASSSAATAFVPTPSPNLPVGYSGCIFCKANHWTASCEVVKSLIDRCNYLSEAGRCFKCLYLHAPGCCQRRRSCPVCSDSQHHPAICARNTRYLINDVGEDVSSFYSFMIGLSEAKYEELYMAPQPWKHVVH